MPEGHRRFGLISQAATIELAAALNRTFGELSALIRMHAADHPDSIAIVDDTSRLTWGEFNTLMDRCAVALQREGVRKGDIVALLGVNSAVYAAIYLAIVRVGAIAAPLPTSLALLRNDARLRCVRRCEVRWRNHGGR